MKRRFSLGCAAFLFVTGVAAVGCGTGNEPLSLMGDPSQALGGQTPGSGPSLIIPLPSIVGTQAFTPYSASRPYWQFQNQGWGLTTQVVAPGSGFVQDISNNSITIYHNAHVISRIQGVVPAAKVVGSLVAQGDTIGTVLPTSLVTSAAIRFYTFVDGETVCPLSLLNQAARTAMVNDLPLSIYFNYSVQAADPCQ